MRLSRVWYGPIALTAIALVILLALFLQPVGELLRAVFIYALVSVYLLMLGIYWGGYQGSRVGWRFANRNSDPASVNDQPTAFMVIGGVVGIVIGGLIAIWLMSLGLVSIGVCFFC